MKKWHSLIIFALLQQTFAESMSSFYSDVASGILVSPVSAAMGNSDISLGSGAAASCSPANLALDSLNMLSFSYANFFQNTFSTSMLSYSGKTGNSGYSITAGYIFISDIDLTDNLDTMESGDPIVPQKFRKGVSSDILIRVGYARSVKMNFCNLSVGGAANASRRDLGDFIGYGLGVDAGVTVQFPVNGISASLLMENLTTSYTYWNASFSEYQLPHLKIGAGWEKEFKYIYGKLRVAYTTPDLLSNEGINDYTTEFIDNNNEIKLPQAKKFYEKPSILIMNANWGAEYLIMNRLALRLGITQKQASFGAGLYLFDQKAGFDFAYKLHELAGTYQLSMNYRW
jgi:hypothetical protein